MTIEMNAAWVNANGGAKNLRVVHIGNDGNVEVIVPTVRFEGNTAYIDVDSPAGFSSFVLIAAGEPPIAAVPTAGAKETAETTSAAGETQPTQTPFPVIGGLTGMGIAVLWWSNRHDRNQK